MSFALVAPPRTRLVRDHKPWNPWKYQQRAVDFLMNGGPRALFLDPGLGKTSIVLEAFRRLQERGEARKMLVIAPLRVCQLVWRQEGRKWTEFRDLRFTLIHGRDKAKRLKDDVDIYLINPEGVAWLTQQFYGRTDLPWDIVVIDELTKFKNHKAGRSKKLRLKIKNVRRRWGLTGSPAPNGYMDLFGQMLILDDGKALGRYITYFRDQYFTQDFNGFTWNLRSGSAPLIEAKIAPLVLRMAAADYLELPALKDNIIPIQLPPAAAKLYADMRADMILALPEGIVTAANAGAVYSKLAQMANGAVYLNDRGEYAEVHNAKLDALEELIDELAGQPLLVAYEFRHDLARIRERLGADTPALAGASEKRAVELEGAWNRGEIPVLLVHPASVGHGLNLQEGGAAHICWFSRPWDLELYDQTIRRLLRQGTVATRVFNHVLCVTGLSEQSMDELKGDALGGKDTTQQGMLRRLNAEILRDDPAPIATGSVARREDADMVKKLGFRGDSAPAETSEAPRAVIPKGWGAPAVAVAEEPEQEQEQTVRRAPKGWGSVAPVATEEAEQRGAIAAKISAPPPAEEDEPEEVPASVRALAAFGPGVVSQLTGEDEPGEDQAELPLAQPETQEAPKRGRGRKAAEKPAPENTSIASAAQRVVQSDSAPKPVVYSNIPQAAGYTPFTINVNVKILFPPEIMALVNKILSE